MVCFVVLLFCFWFLVLFFCVCFFFGFVCLFFFGGGEGGLHCVLILHNYIGFLLSRAGLALNPND